MGTIAACSYSERLTLQPLLHTDAPHLQSLGQDSSVFRFIPQISVPFNATEWVSNKLGVFENYVCHVIRPRGEALPIGYVQINRRDNLELELGYWLGRAHWGKKFGLEAAALSLMLFRSAGGGGRVFAAAFPENVASVQILLKLGFSKRTDLQSQTGVVNGMNDYVLHL